MSYGGGRIIVTGGDLKITAFSKSNGNFSATGTVSCVKYAQKAVGLKQKLFR